MGYRPLAFRQTDLRCPTESYTLGLGANLNVENWPPHPTPKGWGGQFSTQLFCFIFLAIQDTPGPEGLRMSYSLPRMWSLIHMSHSHVLHYICLTWTRAHLYACPTVPVQGVPARILIHHWWSWTNVPQTGLYTLLNSRVSGLTCVSGQPLPG